MTQIFVTVASVICPSWEEFAKMAVKHAYQLTDRTSLWESIYIFKQICSGFRRLSEVNVTSKISEIQGVYKDLMHLIDENCPVSIIDIDRADDCVPELICSMVAKMALHQVLTSVRDNPPEEDVVMRHDYNILQLRSRAEVQLTLLSQLVPRASSASTYAYHLGHVPGDSEKGLKKLQQGGTQDNHKVNSKDDSPALEKSI